MIDCAKVTAEHSATTQAPQPLSIPQQTLQAATTPRREALEQKFPIGVKVTLKFCPSGEPGEVVGFERGRLVVRWPDCERHGRYMSCSLELLGQDTPRTFPECQSDGTVSRLS